MIRKHRNPRVSRCLLIVRAFPALLVFGWAGFAAAQAPLRFEQNEGQVDRQARFLASTRSGETFLAPSDLVLRIRNRVAGSADAVVRLGIKDANPNARISGLDPLPGKTNYFLGNDPKKWVMNVPSFAKVKYADLYPGIDLICYGTEGNLEYDFVVSPGADPGRIAMSIEGAEKVSVDGAGNLLLRTAAGEIRQNAPRIYQEDGPGGAQDEIAGGYLMKPNGAVAFQLARYDAKRPLVIDPQVVYSTYFGGTSETDVHAVAVDAGGSVYVAGDTFAHDFPTKDPEQSTNNHGQSLSAIVTKFGPDGKTLEYSTYLGGSGDFTLDAAVGIAIDSTGAAYVTGTTGSADFPTKNAIPGVAGGGTDIFVTKLSADGSSLVYSSRLGGSGFDEPRGIVLDGSNNAYLFGDTQSTDFPTVNPTQAASGGGGFKDGFWSVVSADGTQLLFSTYMGGNNDDDIRSLAVLQTGDVYVTGQTQSSDFVGNNGSPTSYHAHFKLGASAMGERTRVPEHIGLLFEISSAGSWLYSGVLGSFIPVEIAFSILYDRELQGIDLAEHPQQAQASEIEVFVSSGCVPLPPSTTCTGNAAVVTADAETLEIKSVVNLPDTIPPITAAMKDAQGAIYAVGAAGRTSAPPLVAPTQSAKGGGDDGFLMVLAPGTREILFSTYLGGDDDDEPNGVTFDAQGNIYVAGQTQSSNFPTKNAYQATAPAPNGASIGDGNSFIAKFSAALAAPPTTGPRAPVNPPRGEPSTRVVPRP